MIPVNYLVLCIFYVGFFENSLQTININQENKGFFDFFQPVVKKPCFCKCGIPNRNERLMGGVVLKKEEFPWIANVHIKTETIGGVLINDKYVLTAAGPLNNVTASDVKVSLGQNDRCVPDVSSIIMSINIVKIHPEFNPKSSANNIALLRLTYVVAFSRSITPICLPMPETSYLGQVATVVGWTQESDEKDSSLECRPRKLGLPVLGEECKENEHYIANHQGCIGVAGSQSFVCKADAGGPVQFRSQKGIYELIGVLSDINKCDDEPSITMYTKVNAYLTWITRNTRDACYCIKI